MEAVFGAEPGIQDRSPRLKAIVVAIHEGLYTRDQLRMLLREAARQRLSEILGGLGQGLLKKIGLVLVGHQILIVRSIIHPTKVELPKPFFIGAHLGPGLLDKGAIVGIYEEDGVRRLVGEKKGPKIRNRFASDGDDGALARLIASTLL